jgi:putative copper export protein/methionine-rich copper-binding protein CopC
MGAALLRFLAVVLVLLVASVPQPARAHGYIVRSIPENRATLERAPVRLQYWFSEDLEPDFSSITVRDQAGNTVAQGGVSPDDLSLMEARLPTNIADGAYISELRVAFASDGHVIVESRVFFVGQASTDVAGLAASDQAVTLEVIWRVLVYASLVMLLGVTTLYNLVLLPAWGSKTYAAGHLPPRVMSRLNWIMIAALALAFGGNLLALLQQSMVFFGADVGRVLSDGLWQVVRIGTRFGDTWNIRMLLLALVAALHGASIYLRNSQPETVRAFWAANAWLMALCLGTLSLASHAAGSLILPWIALLSDWLHILAVGFWVGGVTTLALILPVALRPYTGEARRQALLAALNRFSPIAAAGLVVVVATGIYSAANWVSAPTDLGSSYGRALALKLLLVAILALVGAAHFIALRPARYTRFSGMIWRIRSFVPTLRLEAVLSLLVLAAAAFLSATPVPKPDFDAPPPPSAALTVSTYEIATTVTPGGLGVNTYDVLITQDGEPVDGLDVFVRMVNPAQDWRGDWHTAENLSDGLYSAAGADIDRAGHWLTLVRIEQGGEPVRAVFEWDISADAGVIESIAPRWFNLAALVGILLAAGYAAFPLARRFYRRLDLSPSSVTIALGATAATIVIVIAAALAIQQAQQEYEVTINPPPQVVNAVLPDGASLERGQTLLSEQCAGWQQGVDWEELIRRLSRLRDEELFSYTRNGWRSLPPCGEALTESQRWDVVNYIRSMEAF